MDAMTGIAGPQTIFRSSPVGPTQVGNGVHAAVATRLGPMIHSDVAPPFGAASTRLAPAAPPLAYSMTGNMEALTAYVHEYDSGPNDWHEAQVPHHIHPDPFDPDLDASHEQAPLRPARKSLLLVGGLAAAFIGIGVAVLTTAMVITVTPAADQKPITSTQQPVPTPLATRVSEPSVVTPAAAPVQPPPAPPAPPVPPAIAPAPKAPVVPRQAPPRTTQTQPRTTQTQPGGTQTASPSDQELAPGDVPQHSSQGSSDVPPADDGGGPLPDERGIPSDRSDAPLDEGDAPPPRSHSPFSPHVDELPPGDGSGEPRRGGGGLLGGVGCIPLLPC